MEMRRRTSKSIQRVEEQDHKLASTHFTKEKKENSEQKLMYQDMQLKKFYIRNRKRNRNPLHFYQG